MVRRHRGKMVRRRGEPPKRVEAGSSSSGGAGRRQLVDYVARGLVDDPSAVRVSELDRSDVQVYELSVAMGDLGKVIGKNGRTAQAMRTLLALTRSDDGRDPVLDILD